MPEAGVKGVFSVQHSPVQTDMVLTCFICCSMSNDMAVQGWAGEGGLYSCRIYHMFLFNTCDKGAF